MAILISREVLFEPSQITADNNGRFLIVSGKLFDTNVVLANTDAPNMDDVSFFEQVFSKLPELNTRFLLLGWGLQLLAGSSIGSLFDEASH